MLVTTDNKVLELTEVHQLDKDNLSLIANKSIGELVKANPKLLIFPEHFKNNEDDIASDPIFELTLTDAKTILTTGNIMGFIGVRDTQLKIRSRFAQGVVNGASDVDNQVNQESRVSLMHLPFLK